jgi:hypothetical protein
MAVREGRFQYFFQGMTDHLFTPFSTTNIDKLILNGDRDGNIFKLGKTYLPGIYPGGTFCV